MLLLGVYVCPRHSQLVFEDGRTQLAPDAWLTEALGSRRSLSLDRLSGVRLTKLSTEVSEEWELLLADWQNASTHVARVGFAKQAAELEGRAKLPPHLFHQYKYLREQAAGAQNSLDALDSDENDALERLEKGYERQNVSLLSWSGRDLMRLRERLTDAGEAWTAEQIAELDPHIQRATQACIQFFDQWLQRQTPRSTDPADAGNFKHKLDNIRKSLMALGLQEQAAALEKHIDRVFRNMEKVAAAHQLVIEVDNWCSEALALSPVTRMAEINGRSKALRDLRDRVNALRRSLELEALDAARQRIQEAGKHIEGLQKRHAKRFDALDRMSLTSDAELETAQAEVQSLLSVFEGCDSEIEDLLIMRRILALFASDYALLADITVQDDVFKEKLNELSVQREATWDEDEEQPWDIPATYAAFGKSIGKLRKANADAWLDATLISTDAVDTLDTADANRLLEKLRAAPPTLSATHEKQVGSLARAIERHLAGREMEWLLERFRQLPARSQKRFLDAARKLLE